MSLSLKLLSLSLLLLLLPFSLSTTLTADLRRLQSKSPTGIIRLNDLLISRILSLSPNPLPFSLLIFFNSQHLHKTHPQLNLDTLFSQFQLLSKSHLINRNPQTKTLDGKEDDIFFFEAELKVSESGFSLLEVNSLPHIRLVKSNTVNVTKSGSVPMPVSDFESVEKMAEFVMSETGINIGEIRYEPFLNNWQKGLIGCGFSVLSWVMVKFLLHDRRVWVIGAVFVYFFSVSGTMHGIIRKTPLVVYDKKDVSKVLYFYKGSGMQLGAEGFAVGGLYTIVGLLVAFVNYGLVRVKNGNVKRLGMVLVMLVSFWAVKEVVFLDNWKTGYGIHMYWPTGWR